VPRQDPGQLDVWVGQSRAYLAILPAKKEVAVSGFDPVFEQLKAIMKPYQNELVVKTDEPGHYSLNTSFKRPDGYVLWFGGVQIKKNYVSYHLMPVYGYPELLQGISPELKKRMQGKSCFNFKKLDDALLEELKALTKKGFECFKHGRLV
jgi:hypothetical protein